MEACCCEMPEKGQFIASLGGVLVRVNYKVYGHKGVKTTFSYLGKLFEFNMPRWSRKGWSVFVSKFLAVYKDTQQYGSAVEAEDGNITFDITPDQLSAILLKATKDVFVYVDQLLREYQKQILDYCVWYREKSSNLEDYAEYIQLVACHCVVHSQFLAGNVAWNVVPFEAKQEPRS